MTHFSKELLRYLACPDCQQPLELSDATLHCPHCRRNYNIQDGIPLLYPRNLDQSHLQEETELAELMHRHHSEKADYNAEQWAQSKEDFWDMVEDQIPGRRCSMLYIGSGYDHAFERFQRQGHLFINFDMIPEMLKQLRTSQAEVCIAGDMNALPFQNNRFDALIVIDVLHHESNHIHDLLKHFSEILVPGGRLFIEDINAWGLFQFYKSILMPKPVYRFLRSFYHSMRHGHYPPAGYEFPTSYPQIRRLLKSLNYHSIQPHPTRGYPYLNRMNQMIYKQFSKLKPVPRYFNYHYMLSAVNADPQA
jgi:SAM-dependent methyltransferase